MLLLLVAVRKGRYSLERRAETIIESKKMKSSPPEPHGNSSLSLSVPNTSHKRDLEEMTMNGEISHLFNVFMDQKSKFITIRDFIKCLDGLGQWKKVALGGPDQM